MTMLLQNRTISMILTVPDVKELVLSISHSAENLNQKSLSSSKNRKPPSIPIYHGSIICIEQHRDNQNTSDLIVRVPNFHHSSLPTVTISTIPPSNETERQREGSFKRRAPICPILNGSHDHCPSSDRNRTNNFDNSNVNQSDTNSRLTNTKRFAIGLRNLSQTITTNCKSKRSTNINEITIVPVLPDVEIIQEDFQIPTLSKKSTKNQNLTSKFLTPKMLFIKRKCFKIKRKQSSSSSSSNSTDTEVNTIGKSQISINLKDNDVESKQTTSIEPNHQVEQQSTTIAQLIPKIPIILIDSESASTHRYCKISGVKVDPRTTTMINNDTEDISSTNIVISRENNALPIDRPSSEQTRQYDDNNEDALYVVHSNGDTYSECYEVSYEFDPEFQHFLDTKKEQLYLPEIEDQSSIKFNLDPFEYQDLTSALTTWLPIFPNNYEQIKPNDTNQIRQVSRRERNFEVLQTNLKGQEPIIPNIPRVRFHSLEDLSEISDDQTTTYQPESVSALSSSQENDQLLCLDEDYTVIIELLKHVLQIETTTNNTDDEFNQLFQTN